MDDLGVDVQLSAAGFTQGAAQIAASAGGLNQRLNALQSSAWGVQKALSAVTPSQKTIAGLGGFAAAAAATQQNLSGLAASQAVVGQRTMQLSRGIDQMARSMPIGNRGATDLVATVNQLGVAGRGAEKQIVSIAKVAGQLQGATGQPGGGLITDLTQLERTFGNQGLDPRRLRATADALVYTSQAGGASASAVLATANAIGPLAQAAGIGKTQTIGISTALNRIGQDGYAASNAVNTLLTGINRAARDGTPDLNKYANVLGMTATRFKALYASNPVEALTQVTEAIGKAGPQGGRILENLGLESVRTQRALQALSSSGGLRSQIATAQAAYGGGSTARGAAAAYGGLNDTFTRIRSSGEQLATALGRPLLGPLNAVANAFATVAGGATRTVGGLAGSRIGADVLNTAGTVGLGALLARRVAGTAAVGSLGSYLIGSSPTRAAAGGFALARAGGDAEAALATRLGRFGRGAIGREQQYGTQVYERTNWRGDTMQAGRGAQSFFGFGAGAGAARAEATSARWSNMARTIAGMSSAEAAAYQSTVERQASRGVIGRTLGRVAMPFSMAAQTYFNASADASLAGTLALRGRGEELYGNETTPARARLFARGSVRTAGIGAQDAWAAGGGLRGLATGGQAGFFGRFQDSMHAAAAEVQATTKSYGPMRQAMNAFGASVGRQFQFLGAAGGMGIGGAVRRGAGALGGFFGGPVGMSLAAAGVTALAVSRSSAANQASRDQARNVDIGGTAARYAEAGGGASAPITVTSSMAAAQQVANTAVTTAAGAQTVSDADMNQVMTSRNKITYKLPMHNGGLSVDAIIGLGNSINPGGWAPQDAQQFKLDLLRQGVPRASVEQVMGGLSFKGSAASANLGVNPTVQLGGNTGIRSAVGGLARQNVKKFGARDTNQVPEEWVRSGVAGALLGGTVSLKDDVSKGLDNIVSGIITRAAQQSTAYGSAYGSENEWRDINNAYDEAVKSGNNLLVRQLSRDLSFQLTGQSVDIFGGEATKAGGFVQALAKHLPTSDFARQYQQLSTSGQAAATGPSLARPTPQLDLQGQTIRNTGVSTLFPITDNRIPISPAVAAMTEQQRNQYAAHGVAIGPVQPGTHVPIPNPAVAAMTPQQQQQYAEHGVAIGPVQAGTHVPPPTVPGSDLQAATRATVLDYFNEPGNVSKLQRAAESGASYMQASEPNKNLGQLAAEAGKAAGAISDAGTAAGQFASALQNEIEFRMGAQAPYQSSGQNFKQQFDYFSGLVRDNAGVNTDQGKANYEKGRQGLVDLTTQLAAQLKQRLALERQYQIQVARAAQDEQRQETYATEDFNRTQQYAAEDYFRQRGYAQQDFNKSVQRSVRDHNIALTRMEEDYRISTFRAEEDYQVARSRQIRDFNISIARSEQDYLITRGRAIRDFNKQLKRQIEDQAQGLYDPYKRIQTQSVWDARQLMANLSEQSAAIKKQEQQLDTLRRLGISNQTIQGLGLGKAENAQQVAKLVSDLMNDPNLAKQLNATAATRLSLGQLLVGDQSNKDIARARDDFATQLGDMSSDLNKQVARARADMSKSLGDEATDFARTLSRSHSDYVRALRRNAEDFNRALADSYVDFLIELGRSDTAYNISRQRAEVAFGVSMARMRQQYQVQLGRMREDVDESEKEITGSLSDLWDAVRKTMSGQQVDWTKLMTKGLDDTLNIIQNKREDFAKAYKDLVPFDLSKLFTSGGGGPGGGGNPADMKIDPKIWGLFGGQGIWPVAHPVETGQFGDARSGHVHAGLDLAVPADTPIYAGLGGVVTQAGWNGGYGNSVMINASDGRSMVYGHMIRAPRVHVGELIGPNTMIGNVGSTGDSTGNHLHFETRINGTPVDPHSVWPQWEQDKTGGIPRNPGGPWGGLLQIYEILKTIGEAAPVTTTYGVLGATGPHDINAIQAYAKKQLGSHGWEEQREWGPLYNLWQAESGWDWTISGGGGHGPPQHDRAYGIPQALPPEKMAAAGADWATNPYTQVNWGEGYIQDRWKSPTAAWAQWTPASGYGDGAIFNGAKVITAGERGAEALIPLNERGVDVLARAIGRVVRPDDMRSMLTSGHAVPVYHVENHHHDSRVQVLGEVTVQAEDPLAMARKLEAKARNDRLVSNGSRHD